MGGGCDAHSSQQLMHRAAVANEDGGEMRILFLCTRNSCRSQMAEGWARHLKSAIVEPYSAGVASYRVDPLAIKAMAEVGVDISGHRSKAVGDVMNKSFDFVVTVCDEASEACPVFPGKTKVVHVGFDDPPRLAKEAKSEEEAMVHYRRVRDEIRAFVQNLPGSLVNRKADKVR